MAVYLRPPDERVRVIMHTISRVPVGSGNRHCQLSHVRHPHETELAVAGALYSNKIIKTTVAQTLLATIEQASFPR